MSIKPALAVSSSILKDGCDNIQAKTLLFSKHFISLRIKDRINKTKINVREI